MKEQFEKNQKIKVIAMGILSIILIVSSITLFYLDKNNDSNKPKNDSLKTSSTTPKKDDNKYVDAISVDIPNYNIPNEDYPAYFAPEFTIYEGNLYADIESDNETTKVLLEDTITINNKKCYLIKKGIKEVFVVKNGKSPIYLTFAINDDGDLFYIDNISKFIPKSKSDVFKVTKISELKNVVEVKYRENASISEAYAIDSKGIEHNLSDIIAKL